MLIATWEDQEERYTGGLAVEVADVDVEGVTVVIDAGLGLSGRLEVEGGADFELTALTILLVAVGEAPVSSHTARIESDGQFVFQNVAPGTYRVTVSGAGTDLYLKKATLGGQDVLARGLDLTYGTAHGRLDLVLGTGAGHVDGSVVDKQGNPVPGARVALVPAPTLRARSDLYRTAVSDLYGNYTLAGIVPGEYTLFAWQDVPPGAYEDPDFLQPFVGEGVPVTIQERGHLSLRLVAIPSSRNRP
jgi:lipopolysaccharide export system protein LptA